MATTFLRTFELTTDNQTSSFPDDASWGTPGPDPDGKRYATQALLRYSQIGAGAGTRLFYPSKKDGFNVPQIGFLFMNAYGERIDNAPSIQIKMPSLFNVTSFSDYSRTENIFGAAQTYSELVREITTEKVGSGVADVAAQLAQGGITGIDALKYRIQKEGAGLLGWLGSAGLNNIQQYEFNVKRAVNPMAQLLYKGPQNRRYQLPFTFSAKNKEEADAIRKIVGVFRVASSPSVPSTGSTIGTGNTSITISAGNAFTFGYPHLTQFTVSFYDPNTKQVNKLHRSKPCAIESVSVDYGEQKMTFFEDGHPTDLTMTLQLTEVMPRTLGDAMIDASANTVTLG